MKAKFPTRLNPQTPFFGSLRSTAVFSSYMRNFDTGGGKEMLEKVIDRIKAKEVKSGENGAPQDQS